VKGPECGRKLERRCCHRVDRLAWQAGRQRSAQWRSRDRGRAFIYIRFGSGMRRHPRRGANQGLPGWRSDVCIQRAAMRVADQSLSKANASYLQSVAQEIGHERSGAQPAEAPSSRTLARMARLTIFRQVTGAAGRSSGGCPLGCAPRPSGDRRRPMRNWRATLMSRRSSSRRRRLPWLNCNVRRGPDRNGGLKNAQRTSTCAGAGLNDIDERRRLAANATAICFRPNFSAMSPVGFRIRATG
jgi:hypothetical protein